MKTEVFTIADLNAAKYNPRRMLESRSKEYEKLKNSLNKFGAVVPIIVNARTNTVVGGHQRLNILKELGYTEVEASVVDLDETEEKQLNIALNKIEGRWDVQKLDELLETMTDKELEFVGFIDEETEKKKEVTANATTKKEPADDGFEIYVSFGSKEAANTWLEERGIDYRFEDGATSITVHMEARND